MLIQPARNACRFFLCAMFGIAERTVLSDSRPVGIIYWEATRNRGVFYCARSASIIFSAANISSSLL